MRTSLYLLLALLIFNGCTSYDAREPQPVIYHDYPTKIDFSTWRSWERINDKPVKSEFHDAYVDIYVNERAAETYIESSAPYLPGSAIILPLYSDAERSSITQLVIKVKMDPYYSREFGDWWYAVYNEYGTEAWEEGKLGSCIACHMDVQETDFTFSAKVMEVIRKQQ